MRVDHVEQVKRRMRLQIKMFTFGALPLLLLVVMGYLFDHRVAAGLATTEAEGSARTWFLRVRSALDDLLARDAVDVLRITEVSAEARDRLGSDLLARFDAEHNLIDCYRRTPDSSGDRRLPAAWGEPLSAAVRWLDLPGAEQFMFGYVDLDGKIFGLTVGGAGYNGEVTMIGRWIDREALRCVPISASVTVELLPRGVTLPAKQAALVHVHHDGTQLLLDRRVAGRVSAYAPLSDPTGWIAGYVRIEFQLTIAEAMPLVLQAGIGSMLLLWGGVLATVLWFTRRRVSRRLEQMGAAVQAIQDDQKGRCLVPIEVADEIGLLGDAVNTFVKRLRFEALEVERLARAKTEFLASMSHEIRTPMTALSGYADMLMDTDVPDAERQAAVGTIHRNGFHLLAVLNEILDLTHVEDDEAEVQLQACDPLELVLGVQELSRVRANARGLDLELNVHADVPQCVECDSMRVRQVLLNLVGNALKFTETGSVTIAVRIDRQAGREHRLLFDVVDTGIGLTAAQQERIFVPFLQADSSTSRRFGGTGLGLNISRRIAELLGGELTVESRQGEGSRFTLAIALVELANDNSSRPGASESDSLAMPGEGLSILLCESVLATRMLLATQLRSVGMDVTLTEDGLSACQSALRVSRDFDVIVLDMQSRDMDGCVMTQLLRQADFSGAILALTASPSVEERARCIAAGCDEYLFKPFLQVEFVNVLRRLGEVPK